MSDIRPTALGTAPSFGFGDRLGSATPGHLAALLASGAPSSGGDIKGIFVQQSIREMARTNRRPDEVMRAATDALAAAGFDQPWGADADHLKTHEDVDRTADAGFTFFTIDPSEHVNQEVGVIDEDLMSAKFRGPDWGGDYVGETIDIPGGPSITFTPKVIQHAAGKYGRAMEHAIGLARYIKEAAEKRGQDHEIEISVDETVQPTTPAEHYIFADRLLKAGVKLVSLAPRFVGEFEKGVDFIGDLDELQRSLNDHAAVARHLGPYKLSLHSGSDKLSMYAPFARATRGLFHVKTAGTSYLEALRVVATHEPSLFRRIIDFSRGRYDTDKATYHVHATLGSAPPPGDVPDDHALVGLYLEHWDDVPAGMGFTQPGRQILHCTFGSVMTDPELGPAVTRCLADHPDTYRDILKDHFTRHLDALRAGLSCLAMLTRGETSGSPAPPAGRRKMRRR